MSMSGRFYESFAVPRYEAEPGEDDKRKATKDKLIAAKREALTKEEKKLAIQLAPARQAANLERTSPRGHALKVKELVRIQNRLIEIKEEVAALGKEEA